MNKIQMVKYFIDKGLLPFQAKFAASFIINESKPYWQLVSTVGTGKTKASIAIIKYLMEREASKRILILAPVALLSYWERELSDSSPSNTIINRPIIVNRNTYLEMESNVPIHENPWPSPAIILMSIDLSKREDMVKYLCKATWDLVVIDESHLLTGKRKSLLAQLIEAKAINRCLCLSAMPVQPVGEIITKNKKWQEVIDWNGQALYPSFEKTMIVLSFERSKEEKDLFKEVESFAERLAILKPYGKFLNVSILRGASSSVYALEESLRRLLESWRVIRNKIAHGMQCTSEDIKNLNQQLMTNLDEIEEEDIIADDVNIQPIEFMELYVRAESLLDRIEEIQIDSKMKSLVSYLSGKFKEKINAHVCIWTSFINTMDYLASSLQELEETPIYRLTGALSPIERESQFQLYRASGGILITTDVSQEGISLQFVEECINYDLPMNPLLFEQRWGRFHRLGRKDNFRMLSLKDESKSLQWEESIFKRIAETTTLINNDP